MLKLTDNRTTKTISLPSYEGSEVEIYSGLLVGDLDGLDLSNPERVGIDTLPKLIKSWNFSDDNDKPLSINKDAIKKINIKDITFLVDEIQKFGNNVKKN